MLQIYCKNTDTSKTFSEGSTLADILQEFQFEQPFPIVSARVNNTSQGLRYRVFQNRDVEFLDLRDWSAMRAYVRSLCFVLYKAVADCCPQCKVYMEHPISNGYYCHMHKPGNAPTTPEDIQHLRERMLDLINQNLPFRRHETHTEEATRIFREQGFEDKARLLETSGMVYTDYYTLGDTVDYYYGCLVPSTGYLKVWGLEPYHQGMLLRVPDYHDPHRLAENIDQPHTFAVFDEYLRWNNIMHLNNVGDVNKAINDGHASELMQVSEALQEKKIVKIAEEIEHRYHQEEHPVRIVLITGPSSSGKTTFCKRLSIQLLACGLKPISFSTDDYFVNRVDTPKFPDGRYDFDNIAAVDTPVFERDLKALIAGEEVEVPEFNFRTGLREYNGKRLQMKKDTILLIEGIHALNPILTAQIPDEVKFKIFVSALTSVSLDDHNWIPTSDSRLLRRIIRDYNVGAFSARETISQWPFVRDGEERWILPHQEKADVMFNSAMNIEFAVLRNHAEPILRSVPKNCTEYTQAHRLLRFLNYFIPVSDKEIPPTSIMREFVGGSSFKY